MNEVYNLNSILNAIEDINIRPKKKRIIFESNIVKKIPAPNDNILPITESLILEAEEYSNKFKKKSSTTENLTSDTLILNNEYVSSNLENNTLEEIKLNVIEDLYSSLSKKIKKNTLKTIFDLHEKIFFLEKEITILNQNNDNQDSGSEKNETKQNKKHLISEQKVSFLFNNNSNELAKTTIETLKLQESIIKNYEKSEEKLRIKIVDLEQDITILNSKRKK
tara:strand:+ start:146 stop:811 length:666 start_codon:yes stop_codon:yes gene_type:complete